VSGGIGFLGLLVVLLVANRGLWAPFVAFAFAIILAGSTRLRVSLQLDQSLAGVLQGILVLLMLTANGLRQRFMEGRQSGTSAEPQSGFKPITTPGTEAINE
jgi:simple sugar transport system permease protein